MYLIIVLILLVFQLIVVIELLKRIDYLQIRISDLEVQDKILKREINWLEDSLKINKRKVI